MIFLNNNVFAEPKRRRFILIRGLRRIFRIKSQSPESDEIKPSCNETTSSLDTSISRSIDGLDGNSLPVMRYVLKITNSFYLSFVFERNV